MEYSHLLRDPDLKALRAVLGHPVVLLYARAVDVRQHVVTAPYFSLDLGGAGKYCVVDSDWNDTPHTYLDYHMMAATSGLPKGVAARPDAGEAATTGRCWPGWGCPGPSDVVHLDGQHGAVDHIKVLEHRATSESESVHYDHALVFSFADGYRFALSAHKSIWGGLEFSEREAALQQLRAEYRERLTLGPE